MTPGEELLIVVDSAERISGSVGREALLNEMAADCSQRNSDSRGHFDCSYCAYLGAFYEKQSRERAAEGRQAAATRRRIGRTR